MTSMRRHSSVSARWLLAVAALVALYACTKPGADPTPSEPQAVAFDAYLSRSVATRAGYAGILDNASLEDEGFGVFAYYTEGAVYGPEVEPNFMYNTQVTNISGSQWEYSPIKYWPNESSASDDDLIDRLSFFAYAPYVEVAPLSGLPTSDVDNPRGIIQLTTSIDKNDPKVTYKASCLPSKSVDLCWATPTLNMERPDVSTKVHFQFHHALAALNMQIDAAIDELSPGSNTLESPTRIYVRYVTFEGFAIQGVLDLNNSSTTPSWTGLSGLPLSCEEVTVHDGRLDGLEAKYADELETPIGLHHDIVQKGGYNTNPGVTNENINLFSDDNNEEIQLTAPVFVIPNGYPMSVTIEYDVETRDDKLLSSHLGDGTTHGSVTTVRVRQPIDISSVPLRLEAGMKYVIRMHLGMTSVKFEAGMTDKWVEDNEVIILHPVTMGQEVVTHTASEGGWS